MFSRLHYYLMGLLSLLLMTNLCAITAERLLEQENISVLVDLTLLPTISPSSMPIGIPVALPTANPTTSPSLQPIAAPSEQPTTSSAPTSIMASRKVMGYTSCILPYGIVFDASDDLYIAADTGFYRRRAAAVSTDLESLAASATSSSNANASFRGITIDSASKVIYLTNYYEKSIDLYDISSQRYEKSFYRFTSLATTTLHPINIAIDSDHNLYVSLDDRRLSSIMKIDASTHELSNYLPEQRFYAGGLLLDVQAHQLYVSDLSSQQIYRISLTDNTVMLYAGNGLEEVYGIGAYAGDGGPALQASFFAPHGLAFSTAGDLYLADTGNAVIRYIEHTSSIVSLYAGMPTKQGYNGDGIRADQTMLRYPNAIAFDSHGFLYVADSKNNLVRGVYPYDQAPTYAPTVMPTESPTAQPTTSSPTKEPSNPPSSIPTIEPSMQPTFDQTPAPTRLPTISCHPTTMPTPNITHAPTIIYPPPRRPPAAVHRSSSSALTWMMLLLLGGGIAAAVGYYLYYNTELITGKKKPNYQQVEMTDSFDDAFTEDEIEGV
jgi:DNA-binding beta-propeller fold protein YncE